MIVRIAVFMASAAMFAVPLWAAESPEQQSHQRALQALEQVNTPIVKALSEPERRVLKATIALKDGSPNQALHYLESAPTEKDPLVALLKAEAHRRSAVLAVVSAGDYARNLKSERERLEAADFSSGLGEANTRLAVFMDKLDGVHGDPVALLQFAPDIQSVFMVDKARSRMFVYQRNGDGSFQRVADEYVVTGAKSGDKQKSGDARTPNGIYRFVKRIQDKKLESRYGPVVFPIDYPNELDHMHRKNGHGIWLHGYPDGIGRRPPRDTKGCFALPNPRLVAIEKYVKPGHSWVIVGENFAFNDAERKEALHHSIHSAIEQWRQDWTSLDADAYLSHYHTKFRSGKYDLSAWKRYKRRVNGNKSFINVTLSDLTFIYDSSRWPEGEVAVAEFVQHYRSNNYADESRKRLYLARDSKSETWKVLIEESIDE